MPRARIAAVLPLLAALGALGACVNLAPPYERPAAPVAAAWPVAGAAAANPVAAAELRWTEFYGDARLRELIGLALANNRDLRSTALDIEAARAQYGITRASEWPTVDGTAAAAAQGAGARASSTGVAYTTRQYSIEAGFTAYELDFFGRVRNLREQGLENFLATEEALRAARISLVAEVATAYATLAADRQRLQLAEGTLASQQKSFTLTRRTYELGAASALDVAQAQTSVDSARADIATYRTQVTQDLNALTLLVGRPLEALDKAGLADPGPDAGASREGALIPLQSGIDALVGVPSDLLQRRPDVLASERSLRAAHANIGAARAARFPTITLTTSAGIASPQLSRLFSPGTRVWNFAPAVSVPLFDGGAGEANVRLAEVQRDQALAAYDKAIQVAFREVADALAQRRDIGELLDARQSLVTATEKAYRLSEARYRKGVDSSLTALDAQRSLYSAQQNLITARLLEASNLVTLYRVLGGGWQP